MKVIIIKIALPGSRVRVKSPMSVDAIKLYNTVFDELCNEFENVRIIEPLDDYSKIDSLVLKDGIHPNKDWHMEYFNKISAEISKLINK